MRAKWVLVVGAALVAVATSGALPGGCRAQDSTTLGAGANPDRAKSVPAQPQVPTPTQAEAAGTEQQESAGVDEPDSARVRPSRLEVQVVDTAGRPIKSAQIKRDWTPERGWGLAGITGSEGRCDVYVGDATSVRLRVTAPLLAGETVVDAPVQAGDGPFRIVVGGEARGSIRIELGPDGWDEAALCVVAVPAAGSDEAPVTGWLGRKHGPVLVRGARPGTWFVRVIPRWSPEWGSRLPLEYKVDVQLGRETVVVPKLESGRIIRGVLRLPDGSPPPDRPRDAWIRGTGGVKVTLTYRWPSEADGRVDARAGDVMDRPFASQEWDVMIDGAGSSSRYVISPRETTIGVRPDAEGRFVCQLMPTWPVTLRVERDGAIVHESVVTAGDQPRAITLRPVEPCLRLLVPEVEYGAYDWRLTVWRDGRIVGDQSGEGPVLTLAGIAPGPCVAVVHRFDREHREWANHPSHGETDEQGPWQSWHLLEIGAQPVVLRPSPRHVAHFLVRVVEDETGAPAASWTGSYVWRGHTWSPPYRRMDWPPGEWKGQVQFFALPEEPFQVRFSASGREPVTVALLLRNAERREMPDIRLARAR